MIIAPNSDAASRNVVAAAAPNAGTRNSRTSSSGRAARAACHTNAVTRNAPTTIGTHAIGSEMPPCVSVSDSPNTIPARPGERSEAEPVELARVGAAGVGVEQAGGEPEREDRDRHVDVEDPAPGE